jgi:hypothetical protein
MSSMSSTPTTRPTAGDLDHAARNASAAVDAALDVVGALVKARTQGRTVHPDELLPGARAANECVQRTYRGLLALGARETDGMPPARPIPLEQLDTSDTRRLLDLLDQAQAVAERIDADRWRALSADVPLLPGESRGTDLAEAISEIALRVRTEVHGPSGRE